MEGGGTVRLRGGADMGSTVLVGKFRLKETDLGGSVLRKEDSCNSQGHTTQAVPYLPSLSSGLVAVEKAF